MPSTRSLSVAPKLRRFWVTHLAALAPAFVSGCLSYDELSCYETKTCVVEGGAAGRGNSGEAGAEAVDVRNAGGVAASGRAASDAGSHGEVGSVGGAGAMSPAGSAGTAVLHASGASGGHESASGAGHEGGSAGQGAPSNDSGSAGETASSRDADSPGGTENGGAGDLAAQGDATGRDGSAGMREIGGARGIGGAAELHGAAGTSETHTGDDGTAGAGGQLSPGSTATGGPASCVEGRRECLSTSVVRSCTEGAWVQETCSVKESSHVASCDAGICGEACPTGTSECGTACIDLAVTGTHCGACDHDCGGGKCVAGVCRPLVVGDKQDGAFSLALTPDGSGVFWVRPDAVLRCPVTGCPSGRPFTVAASDSTLVKPYVIVVTSTEVYWVAAPATLHNCPAGGCPMQSAQTDIPLSGVSVRELTVYREGVYMAERDGSARCSSLSEEWEYYSPCGASDNLQSMAFSDDYLLELQQNDPSGLYACNLRDPEAHSIRLTSLSGQVVRVHGNNAYVMSQQSQKIYSCALTGCGGVEVDFATNQANLTSMSVDATGVYWTLAGSSSVPTGAVLSCPLTGCTGQPRVLVAEQAQPTSIAVRDGLVYWVNRGLDGAEGQGAVMRLRI